MLNVAVISAEAVTDNSANKINNTGIREQVAVEVTGLPSCLVDKEKEAIYDHFFMDRRLKVIQLKLDWLANKTFWQ